MTNNQKMHRMTITYSPIGLTHVVELRFGNLKFLKSGKIMSAAIASRTAKNFDLKPDR